MTEGRINRAAIFHDATGNFLKPANPKRYGRVTIHCRVGRDDVEAAALIVDGVTYPMTKKRTEGRFDYYGATIFLVAKPIHYYICLLYTSPSPRDPKTSRMPSSA